MPLVSGVDGSESSLRAVDWAADEAALHGLPLRLVYAFGWEQYEGAALALSLGRPPSGRSPTALSTLPLSGSGADIRASTSLPRRRPRTR